MQKLHSLNRRQLLKLLASGALAAGSESVSSDTPFTALFSGKEKTIAGDLRGAAANVGHLLRQDFSGVTPAHENTHDIVIVGGGIAGLSAAWWLQRNGVHNFTLLELETDTGGNSRSDKNSISAYPWGAHYLPLPAEDAIWVRMLLEELQVIRGYDHAGLPIYDDYALCAAPHERLRVRGQWQEGLVPMLGVSTQERRQYDSFFARMQEFREMRGRDGRHAFSIPLAMSSRDENLLALDRISMAQYLQDNAWDSTHLRWYVDYCCRDDYGADSTQVSAWAGIHYFAARSGRAANAEEQTVLTWPQGNGWLAQQLRDKVRQHIQTQHIAVRVHESEKGVSVDCLHTGNQQHTRLLARHVILATPRFIAQHLLRDAKPDNGNTTEDFTPAYAPWLVANISLRQKPQTPHSALAWDNVNMDSRSLGYINASQQRLEYQRQDTVLTWYEPLDFLPPREARQWALSAGHAQLAKRVLNDIQKMHPDIAQDILQLDTWLWGHAMAIPAPDTLWHPQKRLAMPSRTGNIFFAHSDMSGLSLFEEAQYHGVQAANSILQQYDVKNRGMQT